jgi:iron complex outermembrane recepter protein
MVRRVRSPLFKRKYPDRLGGLTSRIRDWKTMKTQTFKSRSRFSAGVASAVLGLAMISGPAFAQTATPQAAEDEAAADEIIVTGTLIANPNITSSSPVSVIGANEIELRQSNSAELILRSLPGVVPNVGQNVNNGNGGASFVDLRGLGANRNIVLLDGVRIVPAGGGGTVNSSSFDLNNIPLALVERVDALTGGASTTYGADAVAGVVNFITKRNFAGMQLSVTEAINEKGDGNSLRADLTIGGNFEDGKGNAVLSVGYQETDPIYQGARGFSNFGISSTNGRASGASPTSVPTTIGFSDGTSLQLDPTSSRLVTAYNPFNFNPFNIFITPFQRFNIYSAANYEVSDKIEVYARGLFSRNSVKTIIAPSGLFGATLTIPANNPFLNSTIRDQICSKEGIALGADCNTSAALPLPGVYRRLVELGPRQSEYVTNIFDYRAGFKYAVTDSIKLDVYGAYGESTRTETLTGYVLNSRVQQALNASNPTTCTVTTNSCVPLNLFGAGGSITPAQVGFIGGVSTVARSATLAQVHGLLSGDFGFTVPMASEPVSFAIGSEYRKYSASVRPDSLSQIPGELGGSGGAVLPVKGGIDTKEVFGELIVPLIADKPFFNELTLEAGLRYSKYSVDTPGNPKFSATTYKFGANWTPVEGLKLRGNYQRAVRAPNIGELFAPVTTGLTNLTVDPCQLGSPLGNANLTAVCAAQGAPAAALAAGSIPMPAAGQANSTGGGNAGLSPEKANTYTVGLVIQPKSFIPGLTLTVDYYNIKIRSAVTTPTPLDVIGACFSNLTAASASSLACTSIRRNPVNGGLSGPTGTVRGLPQPLSNLGQLKTDGIDFTLDYSRDIGFADLNFNFNANYTRSSKFQATPTSYNRDCVGYYSVNCASIQPEFQFNQRTTVKFDNIDVSLLWTHINSVKFEGSASDFLARGFRATNRALFAGTIVNNAGINSVLAGKTVNFNRIRSYDYFDLTTRFHITDNLDLTLSAFNVLNTKPPVLGAQAGSTAFNSGNTYPSTYDAVGRSYSATARFKF